ncbi:MAG: hypothetical protein IAG10_19805 [Planctomycetaceae bacterium]|nr:hypothetical protein [Planctomycetaceae bacterium]
MRNTILVSDEREPRNHWKASLLSERSMAGWIVLVLLAVSGCGSGNSTRSLEKNIAEVDRWSAAASPPDSSAIQEMESLFNKLSPALIDVRDARFNLLRCAAITPDHVDDLRIIAMSYRESLRLLRQQLFNLEREVGAETTRQLVDFIITKGLALGPEIFGEMGSDPSAQPKLHPADSDTATDPTNVTQYSLPRMNSPCKANR